MEKGRSSKVIAIVALCVAVAGLSLGFAAFSSNLVIKSSATVTPNSGDFSVVFDNDSIQSSKVGETAVPGSPSVTTTEITQGEDTIEASTIGNLSATFTEPGQSVTYTFDAVNEGKYIAYLTDVVFGNATGAQTFKACTAVPGTTEAYVNGENGACNDISLTLMVGNETITPTTESYLNQIAIGGKTTVTVTIAYNKVEGQQLADGDFNVAFGDIQLTYSSVRAAN